MINNFTDLCLLAFNKEAIKKLVFSRPTTDLPQKVSGRICRIKNTPVLSLEYQLSGNTVSQKNLRLEELSSELSLLIESYKQANLITTLGDAEYKVSKSGKSVLLGADALKRKLNEKTSSFESAIEELDRRKNYILSGEEDFLKALGISDKNGRVHDKKQAKFRQINRFLEHIENIYDKLPGKDPLTVYDLCCGKSYLSFAVYHYLTKIKCRKVNMLGIDLKRDVISWCDSLKNELSFDGMRFVCDDITNTPRDTAPDMVISLHACDIATDIVINSAIELGAKIILSTPCCHKYLNDKINAPELKFVTDYPHLRNKLCEAITDAIRVARLKAHGYSVSALELTDPENTPKNTLILALLNKADGDYSDKISEYEKILSFVLGQGAKDYLSEIK
jgi:SAM-dependent methyltransferase